MKYFLFFIILFPAILLAQDSSFSNPILPGGHPDPSICRVGDDYYIVNSTFEYFPALPIHHSKDLVNWELIGYGLHRKEQASGVVNLMDVQQNGGIHAPTIRYHEGLFYIIVTNIYGSKVPGQPGQNINFIITAKNPAGPWSDPHVIEGAPGIDPDIFFDDDGKVYFIGTHKPDEPNENGIGEIWVQELDLQNWKLKGKRSSVWKGACGGCCVEGPHIYKENGLYYLLIAEGGTGLNHAVMIAASQQIRGPYDPNPRNPILTSRHLSNNYWVHSTGHADLVELPDGRWYMVALGKRSDVNGSTNMGRETHLIPVVWEPAIIRWQQVSDTVWEPVEYLWPVCAPETGRVERYQELPFPNQPQYRNDAFSDNFDADQLQHDWNFRRVPQDNTYSLTAHKGNLRLYLKPQVQSLRAQYGFIGFRQKENNFEYAAKMNFSPKSEKAEAGISVMQQDDNYINFTMKKTNNDIVLQLVVKGRNEESQTIKQQVLEEYKGNIILKLISKNKRYHYLYSLNGGASFETFQETSDELVLCYGYIGTNIGLYASSNGETTNEHADFDWINYKGFPDY